MIWSGRCIAEYVCYSVFLVRFTEGHRSTQIAGSVAAGVGLLGIPLTAQFGTTLAIGMLSIALSTLAVVLGGVWLMMASGSGREANVAG